MTESLEHTSFGRSSAWVAAASSLGAAIFASLALGVAFQGLAAHSLSTSDFGRLVTAMAVANIASGLAVSVQAALVGARRHHESRTWLELPSGLAICGGLLSAVIAFLALAASMPTDLALLAASQIPCHLALGAVLAGLQGSGRATSVLAGSFAYAPLRVLFAVALTPWASAPFALWASLPLALLVSGLIAAVLLRPTRVRVSAGLETAAIPMLACYLFLNADLLISSLVLPEREMGRLGLAATLGRQGLYLAPPVAAFWYAHTRASTRGEGLLPRPLIVLFVVGAATAVFAVWVWPQPLSLLLDTPAVVWFAPFTLYTFGSLGGALLWLNFTLQTGRGVPPSLWPMAVGGLVLGGLVFARTAEQAAVVVGLAMWFALLLTLGLQWVRIKDSRTGPEL